MFEVIDDDTIPVVLLEDVWIEEDRKTRSKRYQRRWNKLMRNVVKTYPYARTAGELIKEYEYELSQMSSSRDQNYYLERAEESLKREFEGEIRNMTISQGVVLIKLIDRETGRTSFDLIKELKSSFTAFMWQTVARFFGTNLKDEFNPLENETDRMIEEIVQLIESGAIKVEERKASTPEASRKLEKRKERLERQKAREQKRLERKK